MDPLSLTASIATVSGVVVATSKILHDLRLKVKNVPEHVESLFRQIKTFESLLQSFKEQLQILQDSADSKGPISTTYKDSVDQMEEDVHNLFSVLSRMEPLLRRRSSTAKLWLVAREIFSEKQVMQYQNKIGIHCSILANLQAIVNR